MPSWANLRREFCWELARVKDLRARKMMGSEVLLDLRGTMNVVTYGMWQWGNIFFQLLHLLQLWWGQWLRGWSFEVGLRNLRVSKRDLNNEKSCILPGRYGASSKRPVLSKLLSARLSGYLSGGLINVPSRGLLSYNFFTASTTTELNGDSLAPLLAIVDTDLLKILWKFMAFWVVVWSR